MKSYQCALEIIGVGTDPLEAMRDALNRLNDEFWSVQEYPSTPHSGLSIIRTSDVVVFPEVGAMGAEYRILKGRVAELEAEVTRLKAEQPVKHDLDPYSGVCPCGYPDCPLNAVFRKPKLPADSAEPVDANEPHDDIDPRRVSCPCGDSGCPANALFDDDF